MPEMTQKSGTICRSRGAFWNGLGTVERSAVPERNDLERFSVSIRKTKEKSGTILKAIWNEPQPVPLPPFLRNGGESGTLERRAKMTARKGWIDVTQNGDVWDVYDWSEHHDSGALLGTFDDKQEAIAFAQAEAIKRNRKMYEGVLS